MSDLLFDEDDEANTPLTAEEREQLIPSYIALRRELNEAEQINIAEASRWLSSRKRDVRKGVALGRTVPHDRTEYRCRCLSHSDGGQATDRRCAVLGG